MKSRTGLILFFTLIAILVAPEAGYAYIGPGAGFAFMTSFLILFATFFLAFFFFLTCGMSNFLFIPLFMLFILWPFGHAIHGLIIALNGQHAVPFGSFGIGERLFHSLTVDASLEAEE